MAGIRHASLEEGRRTIISPHHRPNSRRRPFHTKRSFFPPRGEIRTNERLTKEGGEGGLLAAQKVVASSVGGGNSLEVILRSHRGEEAAKGGKKAAAFVFVEIRPFPAADGQRLSASALAHREEIGEGGVKWREGGTDAADTGWPQMEHEK